MGYLNRAPTSPRAQATTFASTLGVALTGTTVNTKGIYTDVLTPTSDPGGLLLVELLPSGVAAAQALVDIAIGVAGQEHIVAANLGVNAGAEQHVHIIPLPLAVPVGQTIRARYQRNNASLAMRCSVHVFSAADLPNLHRVQTLGATTATSRGTSVDPGGVINTKGAYSQLTAATEQPINQLLLHIGNQGNSARTEAQYLFDVAVGAAASEQIVIPNLPFSISDGADEPLPNYIGPLPCSIPAGSRVAVRGQSNTADATDRLFDVIAYGIT